MRRLSCLRVLSALLCMATLTFIGTAGASSITLYDDTAGNAPGMQAWLFTAEDSFFSGGTMTETVVSAGVDLITDNAVSAGYGNYHPIFNTLKNSAFPILNRAPGFSVSFELQVGSETHISNNRAGFSVIVLGGDQQGIELGFWDDEIWAQNTGFTHGEGVMFDTAAGEVLYKLSIIGNNYTLSVDSTILLQGNLRDYSSFGWPYSLPNFLFLGDDTGSAGANITLGEIILNTTESASVPSLLLLLL